MKIFTKAFWEDAIERIGTTFGESLLGAMIAAGGFSAMGGWSFWEVILWTTALALVKVVLAGLINPNTGGSLGTTHPAGIVKALVTQKEIKTDGDPDVLGGAPTLAREGETVAGQASSQPNNTPVVVSLPPPAN